jgi:N-acylglucosamine-6-phosphate 2-epimerase
MNEIIEKLEKKVIVSCQASVNEPLYEEKCFTAMIKTVFSGGAGGFRVAGTRDVKIAKSVSNLPVIGISKIEPLPANWKDIVYITATYNDAVKIAKAGADIIALDGTARKRPKETLSEILERIHKELNLPVMADISTIDEGLMCESLGADLISTTLSGYTSETVNKNNGEPDFELLEKLVKLTKCPIILEGRIWSPEHVSRAFDLGAHSVVIGSAITRPAVITQRFVKAVKV